MDLHVSKSTQDSLGFFLHNAMLLVSSKMVQSSVGHP